MFKTQLLNILKETKLELLVTGKGIDVLKNLEKGDYVIKYFDKDGNPTEKPAMTMPIPEGMTAAKVVDTYIEAIGGKDKVMAVKTVNDGFQCNYSRYSIVMTIKLLLQTNLLNVIAVMGTVFQKAVFDGENGYQESRGQRREMEGDALEKAKVWKCAF